MWPKLDSLESDRGRDAFRDVLSCTEALPVPNTSLLNATRTGNGRSCVGLWYAVGESEMRLNGSTWSRYPVSGQAPPCHSISTSRGKSALPPRDTRLEGAAPTCLAKRFRNPPDDEEESGAGMFEPIEIPR